MERRPGPNEARRTSNFPDFENVLQDFVDDQLPINRVQRLASHAKIESRADTWISSTTRNDRGETVVKIGEQAIPRDVAEEWKWGADTKEQQYIVKFSHEYAHVIQEEFDAQLLRWLDGADNVPDEYIPYIQLYAALSNIGGLNGLSQMNVYHEQSRTTGNLSVPVYEDMAETIGSYLLGDEYFLYRIANGRVALTEQQKEEVATHVVSVVETWLRRKGG